VLWPDPGAVPRAPPDTGTGINDVSIVLLGSVGSQRFLLTGDIEEGVDPVLVARGLPTVDLLKVAHHGGRTATTDALLDATKPAVALISVGAGNSFGHPAPGTLARLAAHGVRTYRTDLDGTLDVGPGRAHAQRRHGPESGGGDRRRDARRHPQRLRRGLDRCADPAGRPRTHRDGAGRHV
jgi:beta-lactamase superfamily II metal-dependent hydrolase